MVGDDVVVVVVVILVVAEANARRKVGDERQSRHALGANLEGADMTKGRIVLRPRILRASCPAGREEDEENEVCSMLGCDRDDVRVQVC